MRVLRTGFEPDVVPAEQVIPVTPLTVTRPAMPPFEDFTALVAEIWQSRILTNFGPLHRRFEAAIAAHLGVEHVSLVANATLGLILSLRHAGVAGEVVTTPFSFVATAHAIRFAGATPVFADIDPVTLNLDPAAVERMITPRTTAIVAVHSFGTPCDLEALGAVAARHGLPLVYDAAHAMGTKVGSRSLSSFGDFSVLSFHATKVFSSVEGGAIVSRTREDKIAIDRLVNHGIEDETQIPDIGINAKMSELHAAFGLALLPALDGLIAARGIVAKRYWQGLSGVPGLRCVCPPIDPGQNYYAFPILVDPAYPLSRDELHARLKAHGILARRYFFPLISDQPMYRDLPSARRGELQVAAEAADRILCLPLFHDLPAFEQERIIEVIRTA